MTTKNARPVPKPAGRWHHVPQALRNLPRWLLWRYLPPTKPGRKPRKVPCSPATGQMCDGTTFVACVSFEAACAALEKYKLEGLGFVLGAGIAGIDVDNCIDEQGNLDERGRRISELFRGTYAEVSPSGCGFKLIVAIGDDPLLAAVGKRVAAQDMEIYGGQRYFAVTGDKLSGHSTAVALMPKQFEATARALDALHASVITKDDGLGTEWALLRSNEPFDKVRAALWKLNPDTDNGTWVKYGHALQLDFGDAGFDLWNDWSSTSVEDKYPGDEECRKQWARFERNNRRLKMGSEPATSRVILYDAAKGEDNSAERQLSMSTADDVTMANVEWVWRLWLPKKYLVVYAADSGNGKSTVTAGLVAVLSSALRWPDGSQGPAKPSHVLWLGVEDPHEEMTVPRLTAAGATRSRVHFIDGVKSRGVTSMFSLQDDLDLLRDKLRSMRAKGMEVSALVVDPVTAYMHGKRKIDPHKATELRSVLTPFALLAKEENVAVICITHLTKDKVRGFLDSILGSGALVQLARLCIGFARVPGEGNGSFAMFWGKGNLGPPGVSLRYAIEPATVAEPKTGELIQTSKVVWGAEDATITKETIWGSAHGPVAQVRNDAIVWLRQRLADGEWHVANKVREDAGAAGISPSSLRTAAEMVCGKENRKGTWCWRLRPVE